MSALRRKSSSGLAVFGLILLLGACCEFSHGQPANAPQPVNRFPAERLRRLQSALRHHLDTIEPAERAGSKPVAEAMLAFRKVVGLYRDTYGFHTQAEIAKAFTTAEQAVADLANFQKPLPVRTGFQERAYLSDIDGSPEPYFLYVPKNYDAAKAWPLLIFLHGYHSGLTVNTWYDYMYSPVLKETCEREGVILLMPYGRSNTEFMGVGERDVLHTIELVQEEYNINPRRIVLSGASMGGSGAYSLACHYPDRFAAVIAITGRVDYYHWMEVEKESLPRFKRIRMDNDYARELLPNLRYVPVLVFHGEFDTTMKRTQALMMERLMKGLGQTCEYVELEGWGHTGTWAVCFKHPSFLRLLRGAVLTENPKVVQFRTLTLRYPKAYWVTVERIKTWGEFAEIRAEVLDENTVQVSATNVSALRLGPQIPGIDPKEELRVIVNGKEVSFRRAEDGSLVTKLEPDPFLPSKRPGLTGPIHDVYEKPFLIVYPTPDGKEPSEGQQIALRLVREWMAYVQATPRVKSDKDITDDDIQKCNLILCGGPEENEVLAKIMDKLPVRITQDHYLVGERRFERQEHGLQVVYPNPLNPDRYVLVIDGVPWGPKLQANHKLDFLPDFIVYASDTVKDGTWFPTNRTLCAGFFDANWQLAEETTWVMTDQ